MNELIKKEKTQKFDFSIAADRRKILNLCFEEIYNHSLSEYTLSMRMFDKNTTGINLFIGEWGISGPQIKIKNIYKISPKKYKVIAIVNWYNSENNFLRK